MIFKKKGLGTLLKAATQLPFDIQIMVIGNPAQASHYYSRPRLAVQGEVVIAGRSRTVERGQAWLDHEWSSEVLDPRAVGWDWVGLNFDDGSALMAFRMRDKDGRTAFAPPGVSFEVLSQNSPRLLRGLPEREDGLEEAYWAK
jgi:hypothetical protein